MNLVTLIVLVASTYVSAIDELTTLIQQPCRGNGSLLVKRGMLQAESQDSSVGNQQLQAWAKRRYQIIAHVKGGFRMCQEAGQSAKLEIYNLFQQGFPPAYVKCHAHDLGHIVSLQQLNDSEACFGHITRNPFEMVVSGYLYDMANAEGWMSEANRTNQDIACDPVLVDCKTADKSSCGTLRDFAWNYPDGHHRSVAQLYRCTMSGTLSGLLPDVLAAEKFPEYLRRVDTDAGLIAQTIWASDDSLASMRFNYDMAAARECGTNVCFSDFYGDCLAQWKQILNSWSTPEPYSSALLKAAMKSCPSESDRTKQHSSENKQREAGLNSGKLYALVQRLRELDRLHLNGTLHELERHLGCAVGDKYLPPRP